MLIDWIYFKAIAPRFGYIHLINDSSAMTAIVSWVTLLFFYILARKLLVDGKRNSGVIFFILFFVSFIPFTTCIHAGLVTTGFFIYNSVYWAVLIIGLRLMTNKNAKVFPKLKVGYNVIGENFVSVIGIASVILVLFISWYYSHFRLQFDLFSVYNIRLEARAYNFPRILSYLFAWTLAINPILLGLCIVRKRWIAAGVFFLTQMFSFGINGLKTTFFMPFLVIMVVYLYKKNNLRKLKQLIIVSLCGFMALGCLECYTLRTTHIADFAVRRILIAPNHLGGFYYDFIMSNEPDYFRSSFLRHFGIQSPYTKHGNKGISYLIGALYFGKPNMNCNNGLSSDAVANLGLAGCVIMPVLLAYCLILFDRSTVNVDSRLCIAPAIYLSYNLLSTTLTTVMLTHGFLLVLLLMSFLGNTSIKTKGVSG